jgi:transposase
MEKNLFIGIDFSKEKFDVSLIDSNQLEDVSYQCFANNNLGCIALLKWIKGATKRPHAQWLFCGEHTGLYSVILSEFLSKKKLFMWLENPLQIKRSTGIKREKNDKIDSRDIALYAYRFQDQASCFQLSDTTLKSLELLLSFRERLLRNKHALSVSSNEMRKVLQRNPTARYIYEQSKRDIERIEKKIKEIEKKMLELVNESGSIKENYELVSSIKGIALINTITMMVATQNFTRFQTSRQLACYAGLAPFGKQSGTSVHTKPHVSHLANKRLKALLTQAAKCAIRYDMNLRNYYLRKLAEGKNEWVVINNVRNKIVHRIFALVKNKQLYQVQDPCMEKSMAA